MLIFMRGRPSAYKLTALVTTIITLAIAIYLATQFKSGTADFQFQENVSWIPNLGISYHLGVDGISLLLVLLTTLLSVVAILGTWNSIKDRGLAFFISLLVLETGMLGVFVSMDLFLFYVFWEIQLIPMYFIIGLWGGARRIYAAIKFFLYTFAGSVLMLVAILAIVWWYSDHSGRLTFDILTLQHAGFSGAIAVWSFAAFFIAFAIKVPDVPGAHLVARRPHRGAHRRFGHPGRRAPQDGGLRDDPLLHRLLPGGRGAGHAAGGDPVGDRHHLWGGHVAGAARHEAPGGLLLGEPHGLRHPGAVHVQPRRASQGSILQMVSHGILTGALFMMVGFFYDRTHTRLIKDYGGHGPADAGGGRLLQPVRRRQSRVARA